MRKILILISFLLLSYAVEGQSIKRANPFARAQVSGDTLGPELIDNGTFTADEKWSKSAQWTITGGTANYTDGVTNSNLTQAAATLLGTIDNSTTYRLTFDVIIASGAANIRFYDGTDLYFDYTDYANGSHVVRFTTGTAGYSDFAIRGNVTSSGNFSIDNVSLKKVL